MAPVNDIEAAGSDAGQATPHTSPAPEASRSRCWWLGASVFLQYFLIALDIRFVSSKNYPGLIIVNASIALVGWYVVKGVAEAQTLRERLAYVAGGTSGAVLAVWLS